MKAKKYILTNREAWLLYEAYKRIDGTPESIKEYIGISSLFFHGHERTLKRMIKRKSENKKTVLYIILLMALSISTIGLIVANWLGLLPFEIGPIIPILL